MRRTNSRLPAYTLVALLSTSTVCLTAMMPTAHANPYASAYLTKINNQINKKMNTSSAPPSLNRWDTWVENSEVRFNTDNLSTFNNATAKNNHSYSLRLKLKNTRQQQAEKDLLHLDNQKGAASSNTFRLNELRRSYGLIQTVFVKKQEIDSLSQKLNLAKLESTTYKKLVATGEFNPSRVQQAVVEANRLSTQIRFNNKLLHQYLTLIGVPVKNKPRVQQFLNKNTWLIGIQEMLNYVDNYATEPLYNPTLQKLNLASRIAHKERQLAQAELATAVQLVEVGYDANKDLFGATVGVRIPLGKNSFDTLRRKNGYQQAQRAWELQLDSIKNNLSEKKRLLHQNYDAYRLEQNLRTAVNTRLKRVLKSGRPELILALKKEHIIHQSRQQEIYLKMIDIYLDFITLSGQILEQPLRNWLQKGRPLIRG